MNSSLYRNWGEKAAENALSLAEEARLLIQAERFPRAYYPAHMSMEESTKSILLYTMSVSGTPEDELSKVSTLLRNHRKKIEFLVQHAASSSKELQEQIAKLQPELISHINDLKNNTMYVSCKNKTISTPIENVKAVEVELHVKLSEALSSYAIRLLNHHSTGPAPNPIIQPDLRQIPCRLLNSNVKSSIES